MPKNAQILRSFTECKAEKLLLSKGKWKLEVWGSAATSSSYGGYASGIILIKNGIIPIFINLGSKICNGGGSGYLEGGGASDLRAYEDTLYHRFLVAGGAGVSASNAAGGGYNGVGLLIDGRGKSGRHDGPGVGCWGTSITGCSSGSFGYGGNSTVSGGGGGGWFGGASGGNGNEWFAGGGGSGYALNSSSFRPEGYMLNSSKELFLTKIKLIQGDTEMPDPENKNAKMRTGNTKSGFARITLLSSLCTNSKSSSLPSIKLVSLMIAVLSS